MIHSLPILLAAVSLAACQEPGAAGSRITAQPAGPAPASPPPTPAFKPGMAVLDRTGARVGPIQTVTDTPGGLNVVVKIDGKLVGLLASTLRLQGETAVSSQTKEEMLATSGAPP